MSELPTSNLETLLDDFAEAIRHCQTHGQKPGHANDMLYRSRRQAIIDYDWCLRAAAREAAAGDPEITAGLRGGDETSRDLGPREPNNDMVICPNCTSQFVAIPVNVQSELSRLRAFANQFEDDPDIELPVNGPARQACASCYGHGVTPTGYSCSACGGSGEQGAAGV